MESRSNALLDKVWNQLDKVDVSTLSFRDMQDFLEVVQKGRFLETIGQTPSFGFGGFGGALTRPPETSTDNDEDGDKE